MELSAVLAGVDAGFMIDADPDSDDIIFRTSKGGKVYPISKSEGRIVGGLGPELKGAKVGGNVEGNTENSTETSGAGTSENASKALRNQPFRGIIKKGAYGSQTGLRSAKTGEAIGAVIEPFTPKRKDHEGWEFDWTAQQRQGGETYALRTEDGRMQGMVAIKVERGYVELQLAEAAPHNNKHNKNNKTGKKEFDDVGGHLFAMACKKSMDTGGDGYVGLSAVSSLIPYYQEAFGARLIPGTANRMEIDERAARVLIEKYYGG